MSEERKNLKDTQLEIKDINKMSVLYQAVDFNSVSYTKTNKLITGLYMVTDIIDKEEPIRNKLRTLGTGVISDIYSMSPQVNNKIAEIMSFLDIASAVNIISEMNCGILKKEFINLKGLIFQKNLQDNPPWLEEFIKEDKTLLSIKEEKNYKGHSIGHIKLPSHRYEGTRIGVQKGSTLMKALDKVKMSDRNGFNISKKQRREHIIKVIKNSIKGATITDIKTSIQGTLVSCGEKTLQRELVSMLKDNLLKRIGEKRWSRYFLADPVNSPPQDDSFSSIVL